MSVYGAVGLSNGVNSYRVGHGLMDYSLCVVYVSRDFTGLNRGQDFFKKVQGMKAKAKSAWAEEKVKAILEKQEYGLVVRTVGSLGGFF